MYNTCNIKPSKGSPREIQYSHNNSHRKHKGVNKMPSFQTADTTSNNPNPVAVINRLIPTQVYRIQKTIKAAHVVKPEAVPVKVVLADPIKPISEDVLEVSTDVTMAANDHNLVHNQKKDQAVKYVPTYPYLLCPDCVAKHLLKKEHLHEELTSWKKCSAKEKTDIYFATVKKSKEELMKTNIAFPNMFKMICDNLQSYKCMEHSKARYDKDKEKEKGKMEDCVDVLPKESLDFSIMKLIEEKTQKYYDSSADLMNKLGEPKDLILCFLKWIFTHTIVSSIISECISIIDFAAFSKFGSKLPGEAGRYYADEIRKIK